MKMKVWKITYTRTYNSPRYVVAGDFYEALKKAEQLIYPNEDGQIRSIELELYLSIEHH